MCSSLLGFSFGIGLALLRCMADQWRLQRSLLCVTLVFVAVDAGAARPSAGSPKRPRGTLTVRPQDRTHPTVAALLQDQSFARLPFNLADSPTPLDAEKVERMFGARAARKNVARFVDQVMIASPLT